MSPCEIYHIFNVSQTARRWKVSMHIWKEFAKKPFYSQKNIVTSAFKKENIVCVKLTISCSSRPTWKLASSAPTWRCQCQTGNWTSAPGRESGCANTGTGRAPGRWETQSMISISRTVTPWINPSPARGLSLSLSSNKWCITWTHLATCRGGKCPGLFLFNFTFWQLISV